MTSHAGQIRDRNVLKFIVATFITNLGTGIQTITAAFLTLTLTGSVSSVGFLFLLATLPKIVVSIFAGRIADKFNKKWIMVLCDVASAATIAAMAIIGIFGDGVIPLSVIYGGTFLVSLLESIFSPASNAIIGDLARPERHAKVSAQFESAIQLGALLSVAVGGFFVAWFGPIVLFGLNALSFLLSAAITSRILVTVVQNNETEAHFNAQEVLEVQAPSIRVRASSALLFALGRVVVTVSNTLLVVLVIKFHGNGIQVLGMTDALAGLGVLLASLVFIRVHQKLGDLVTVFVGYGGCAVFIALQPQGGTIWLMVFFTLGAIFFGLGRIAARSILLKCGGIARSGRSFGASNALGLAITVVAIPIVSKLVETQSIQVGYIALSFIIAVGTIGSVLMLIIEKAASSREMVTDP